MSWGDSFMPNFQMVQISTAPRIAMKWHKFQLAKDFASLLFEEVTPFEKIGLNAFQTNLFKIGVNSQEKLARYPWVTRHFARV